MWKNVQFYLFQRDEIQSDISMMHISGCLIRDQIIREKYNVLVMLAKAQNFIQSIENIYGLISQRLEGGFLCLGVVSNSFLITTQGILATAQQYPGNHPEHLSISLAITQQPALIFALANTVQTTAQNHSGKFCTDKQCSMLKKCSFLSL